MNWDALGAIGEIVGAIAVIVTLGYLAAQIRQHTREVRLGAFQNTTDRVQQWNADLARNPELARIYSAGLVDPESLNENDRIRFDALAMIQFRNWEDVFLHHRRALVDDEIWTARHAAFKIFIAEPGLRWHWNRRRPSFTRSFAELVDRELEETSARAPNSSGLP